MKKIAWIVLLIWVLPNILFAQDLFKERIRKIDSRKKSIYHESGIFSLGKSNAKSVLKGIRHSFTKRLGYERVVFDFTTPIPPRVYSYKSKKNHKLYIDFFSTRLGNGVGSFGDSKFVNMIDIFPVQGDQMSIELGLKKDSGVELFYLENPGRLVVDIRK
ncbi:MAG: hypothetical protein KAG61_01170 [Bacteriovoracaceae bacterium]|nr:hypothetical protein [Bacteriovoracaceae bacterium]